MNRSGGSAGVAYDEWGCDPNAPLSIRFSASAIAAVLRAVYVTARKVCLQPEVHDMVLNSPGGAYIGVLWHRHIALPSAFFPGVRRAVCLVSRSRDGELLARVIASLGGHCIRGSSTSEDGRSKGGAAALRGMARAMEEGFDLVVTPDGPKGPPRRLKMGVVSLGAVTGRPIVPLGFAVSRSYRVPSWDGTLIPLPFSKMVLCYGEILEVPGTDDSEVLEAHRAELERRLNAADAQARTSLGQPEG